MGKRPIENIPFRNKFQLLSDIYFVVCKWFQIGHDKNFVVWKINTDVPSGNYFILDKSKSLLSH